MLLSDRDIKKALDRGSIAITPFDSECLQPASYDVHLGENIRLPMQLTGEPHFDLDSPQPVYPMKVRDYFWLPPGGVALGHTEEVLTLRPFGALAADIAGCSGVGRWFQFVHVTAGFIDPGWSGQLTLELFNASPWHLRLTTGMRIAQIRFYHMESAPETTYGQRGSYNNSMDAVPSRYKR